MQTRLLRAGLLAALLAAPAAARGTGALMLTGPIAISRDLVAPDEPAERGLRLFALGTTGRTGQDLRMVRIDMEAHGGQVGFVRRTAENVFVMLSGGAHAGGAVDPEGAPGRDLGAGPLVQAAVTWRVVEGFDEDPFVTTTFGLSVLRGESADGGRLDVTDLSLGLAVGRAFGEAWAPYLAAKAFTGATGWRWEHHRVHGNDTNRWAAAVGLVLALPSGLDLQAEVAPVGARGATLALGWAW